MWITSHLLTLLEKHAIARVTVALGSGGVALASGLPLGLGWFIRRRLGLDASDILDRKLGLK
ncbi:hypothetical protein BLIG_01583 [Bifidobacterium longum subsp. infantis CCUG 52486]|uniref:Uncharacterized protein n=1 Tax=Bifidobacterium longum subsp. infantis CCUG 52486 TaxID=537937 RepID=C5EB65_BIFLI|nr:hypothetical protein BLIG_01583 [Bifidobacterium longum subsp. infantis CCUG 52486]